MSWFTDIGKSAAPGAASSAAAKAPAYVPGSIHPFQKTPAPATGDSGGGTPSYVNMNDPTDKAIWNAFQAKGIQPRDQQDFDYWKTQIANNGGLNSYWLGRLAQSQGGVGDYSTGGGATGMQTTGDPADPTLAHFGRPDQPYASNPFGEQYTTPDIPDALKTPFTAPTQAELEASPGYMERLKMGEQGVQRNAGLSALSGGTLKSLERYRQDYASNEYNNLYGQKLGTRQENEGEYQNLVSNTNQQYQNRYGQYLNEQARTLNDYLTNYQVGRNYATDWWNQQNVIADRGLRAATAAQPAG